MTTADVVVVGLGSMGSAACAALARRGARVIGIDRFNPPHAMGEHHGRTRLFRLAYAEHPGYVPLLREAREMWLDLEAEVRLGGIDASLFIPCGGLYAGPPGGALVGGVLESARRHGLTIEEVDRAGLRSRFPGFAFPEGTATVHDPDGAVIACEQALGAYLTRARSAGATLMTGTAVESIEGASGGKVVVKASGSVIEAGSVVVTAGPWTQRLLATLGVGLTVTRQSVGFVRPANSRGFGADRFPAWAYENADGSLYYGTPVVPCQIGMKFARHAAGAPADPDTVDREATEADAADWAGALDLVPGAGRVSVGTQVCLYTNSPDGHFIVDRVPGMEGVVVACGFSGHGFKFVPVMGDVLADLATEGRTRRSIGFLGLGRFEKGRA
ncbi:MAG: N-methyl-L-tryptophan oxidase [Phycisphaeraceae bacterium]|nr:MAG: N-methyl-L-tryptophan oxidase [Phycisphaeraceae bacterium]